MDMQDTFDGLDECIVCYGPMRPAKRAEIEAHLRAASPAYREAVSQPGGNWYMCPRCGPASCAKWYSTELE